ncbi:MAG: ABC transporter substrate-binding protein [Anaerolineaceae bacterium]|nr:ABC transporter substrate-binding protein [Anaerolineaceae bacterium]
MKKWMIFCIAFVLLFSAACTAAPSPAAEATKPAEKPAEPTVAAPAEPTKAAETAPAATPAEPAKTYKDTIIMGTSSDQNSMDPAVNSSNNVVLPNVYSTLIGINNESKMVPGLATEWSVAEDKVTWTFKLRQGVKFQSGKDFTADDCVATFTRLADASLGLRQSSNYVWVKEVSAPDPQTCVIVAKEPYGPVEATLAHKSASIVNSEYVKKFGADFAKTPESIDGTGAYKVTEIKPGEGIKFEAFDGFWGGKPVTKYFNILIIPDQAARSVAIETGQVDFITGLAPDDVKRLKENESDGVNVVMTESNGIHLFQFNVKSTNAPMSNPKVRQAISYAVNRAEICEALYSPLGEKPARSLLSPSVIGYKDMGEIEQDYDKAKQLLTEAGYPDGFKMKIMTTALYNKGVEMAQIIAEQLKGVKIDATIEVVERAVFLESLNGITPEEYNQKYGWDMFIMGAGGDLDAHQSTYRVFHTEADGLNKNNYGFYSNADVDKLLEDASKSVVPEDRLKMYSDAMQILIYDDPIGITMNQRNNVYALSDKVEDFFLNAGNTIDWAKLKVASGK